MSFETILEKIDAEQAVANQSLNNVNIRALPYKKGQINAAKENLEKLYFDYKEEVKKNSIFILVTGSESDHFADIAQEKFKCFKFDAKTFYKDILKEINPYLYQDKKINSSIFEVIGNVLEDKMKSFDVASYPQLMFDAKYSRVVRNKDEMLDVMADAINDIVGGEIVGLDALERVSKDGIEKKYKSRIVPILLYSADERFVSNLSKDLTKINSKVAVLTAGNVETDVTSFVTLEAIDEENVGNALKKIANNA